MFKKIFIEREIQNLPRAKRFLETFPKAQVQLIDRIDSVFNRKKKPYLQKRDQLHAFLGKKRGTMVKEAPDAYGVAGEPHYYFIHSYNCIYECQYCYLQGYFHSPDMVFFLNYDDMMKEVTRLTDLHSNEKRVWFHAGEFSDSLAMAHLTGELSSYHEMLSKNPRAFMELRTKSVNIKELLKLSPLPNLLTTFSLSPKEAALEYDLKTPSLKARVAAMEKLALNQHPLGLHLDPIIYHPQFEQRYRELFEILLSTLSPDQFHYMSLGVVRFTKDVYHQVRLNYPDSPLLKGTFQKSFDQKIRYSRPLRLWMLSKVQSLALEYGFKQQQIYLCMEEEDRILNSPSLESAPL